MQVRNERSHNQLVGYDSQQKERKMNKKLAKISSAKLEIQERHILNFWIHVDYEEGTSQGIGGIALDEYNEEKKQRVGTAFGCEVIRRLLVELNVNDFSEMKGKHIWVHGEGEGLGFSPKGVSALYCDNSKTEPVIFSEVLEDFKQAEVDRILDKINER